VAYDETEFKPVACRAFVVKGKLQKKLKANQRQQERKLLLQMAYLSFVVSLLGSFFVAFNLVQIITLIFTYASKKVISSISSPVFYGLMIGQAHQHPFEISPMIISA
jgi:hypothetical protein